MNVEENITCPNCKFRHPKYRTCDSAKQMADEAAAKRAAQKLKEFKRGVYKWSGFRPTRYEPGYEEVPLPQGHVGRLQKIVMQPADFTGEWVSYEKYELLLSAYRNLVETYREERSTPNEAVDMEIWEILGD